MKKILVVDDSSVQRKMIIQIIKSAGFSNPTLEAEDGVKAIEIIGNDFQDIGLVLCDWNMPNMTGIEVVGALAKIPPLATLPVVMVTTEGTEAKISEAKRANPNLAGYVTKPFTPDRLKETISPILAKAN
ncbi:MAG: response regulator [Candidatus Omnitrophica bacterium]|nr:response regulator [Candidatus Omnitrophota bacterium]